jgi:uncharacterized damage-inducible protein DinB
MQPFFRDCLTVLQDLHKQMNAVLVDLPASALDWKPAGETNSLAVLAVHTAASERYWMGDVAMDEPSGRNREAEFVTRGLNAADLTDRLDASLTYCQGVLERLTLEDLEKRRMHHEREVTVGYALAHTLEHAATHLGHMQITRQVWEAYRTVRGG